MTNLYDTGLWTADTTHAYQLLTHVNGVMFEGRDFKHKSYFCYRAIPIKTCTQRLSGIINNVLKSKNTTNKDRTETNTERIKALRDALKSVALRTDLPTTIVGNNVVPPPLIDNANTTTNRISKPA